MIVPVKTDSHGRLYLPAALRQTYDEKFHVVGYEDRLKLIPIDEDPSQAICDAAGDAFDGESIETLCGDARKQATTDAEALSERGPHAVGDTNE